MRLHYNAYGSESLPALIVLFMAYLVRQIIGIRLDKDLASVSETFSLDARNHGRSPHSDQFQLSSDGG